MNKRFYITTAIDYVNGQPHLGHAYEKVVADVIARSRRSLGQDVFFLTGLDEHGQKVQQAAVAEGKSPQAYCDKLAADWQAFAKKLELTNDDFIRTTDARHKSIVQAGLAKVHQTGHIYKKTYSGFYSTKEETFLTDKDRRAGWNIRSQLRRSHRAAGGKLFLQAGRAAVVAGGLPRKESIFRPARSSSQRGAWFFEKQQAGRPVHLASGGAFELGHSPAL